MLLYVRVICNTKKGKYPPSSHCVQLPSLPPRSKFNSLSEKETLARGLFGAYCILNAATIGVLVAQISYTPSDFVIHTLLFWCVTGPILDALWDMWPNRGSLCLVTAQIIYCVHMYGAILVYVMVVISFFTIVDVGISAIVLGSIIDAYVSDKDLNKYV